MAPIVCIEDDQNDALFMKIAFHRAGLLQPLQVFTNGREALDYILGQGLFEDRTKYPKPCLVLLDLNLPGLSGLEVLASIRRRFSYESLPVAVLTGSTISSDRQKAEELGANEFLTKPLNPTELPEILRRVQARWLGAATA